MLVINFLSILTLVKIYPLAIFLSIFLAFPPECTSVSSPPSENCRKKIWTNAGCIEGVFSDKNLGNETLL